MKNLAVLAVILGALGNVANAESAVGEAPQLTLALNSVFAEQVVATNNAHLESKAENAELDALNKAMEKMASKLNQQLEHKISKELEYAMQ
jgi:hypothetical protein